MCVGCLDDLRRLNTDVRQVCPTCAAFSANGSVCGACQNKPPPVRRLWASARYQSPLPEILHQWKHLRRSELFHPLRLLMLGNPPPWLDGDAADCVLAMPLSSRRRLMRGFNQSGELAEAAAAYCGLPLLPYNTVSRKDRPPQSTLKKAERLRNVRKIFHVEKDIVKNRKVLLIDDVFTTGASIFELAQTLAAAGAAGCSVWVAARNE